MVSFLNGKDQKKPDGNKKNQRVVSARSVLIRLFIVLLTASILTGALLLVIIPRFQQQESIKNVRLIHHQLQVAIGNLNETQQWVDKSSCYATEDRGFGYDSHYFCESKFQTRYENINFENAEVHIGSFLNALRSTSVVQNFETERVYDDYGKQIYPYSFSIKDVKMDGGRCILRYKYSPENLVLEGEIYCMTEVNKGIFDQLSASPFSAE